MVNIVKALHEGDSLLIITSAKKYNKTVTDIVRVLSRDTTCYVSISKTCAALKEGLHKSHVNAKNVYFIDAISRSVKSSVDESKDCYYVSSPAALTELSLVIQKFAKHDFEYVFVDAINNLLIYQDPKIVEKFILSMVNKLKGTDTKIIFLAVKTKEYEDLMKQISMFIDTTLTIQ